MTLTDARQTMKQSNGNHLDKIYIPSLKRDVFFHPLTTADAKTLTRISFVNDFDINVEMIKLSLFDKLCTEDLSSVEITDKNGNKYPPLLSKNLTQIDYLAFLNGIRQLLDNDLIYNFTCIKKDCKHKWEYVLKAEEIFAEDIKNFERQTEFFEKEDQKTGNIWKFELTNFNMEDYFYFKYLLMKIKEKDNNSPQVLFEQKFVKPILYIKNIWLNDEKIDDWSQILIPEKLSFYNEIPPTITVLNKTEIDETLYDFIKKTFIEQKLVQKISNLPITCPKCGFVYTDMFELDNFFTF